MAAFSYGTFTKSLRCVSLPSMALWHLLRVRDPHSRNKFASRPRIRERMPSSPRVSAALAAGVAVGALALLALRRRRLAAAAAAADAVVSLSRDADALVDAAHAALADAREREIALDALGRQLGTADAFVDAHATLSGGPPLSASAGSSRATWPAAAAGAAPLPRAQVLRIGSTESLVDLSAFETPPEGGGLFPARFNGVADDESMRELLLLDGAGARADSARIRAACAEADALLADGQPPQRVLALLGSVMPVRLANDPAHTATLATLGAGSLGGATAAAGMISGVHGGSGGEWSRLGSRRASTDAAGVAEIDALRVVTCAALTRVSRSRLLVAAGAPPQPSPPAASSAPPAAPAAAGRAPEGARAPRSATAEAPSLATLTRARDAAGNGGGAHGDTQQQQQQHAARVQHVTEATRAAAAAVALEPLSAEAHVAKAWAHLAAATLLAPSGAAPAAAAGAREQMCARTRRAPRQPGRARWRAACCPRASYAPAPGATSSPNAFDP